MRRDPILVTTNGPDRILVQCFPVPPRGGVMKARLGITAPLVLDSRTAGTLALPWFAQRNFDVPASVEHAVWIASKDSFAAPPPPLSRAAVTEGEEIRGRLAEPARPAPIAALAVQRPDVASWTRDHGAIVRQTWRSAPLPRPARLVVVIDGSAAMERSVPAVTAALAGLAKRMPVTVLVAGDQVTEGLGRARFEGGTESAPALIAAWDRAAAQPGSAVLWIHGPQALVLTGAAELEQRLERSTDGPPLYTYAAAPGENRLLATLWTHVRPVPRLQAGDLEAFLGGLAGDRSPLVAVRERVTARPEGTETSDHLARLWANDRIQTLVRGTAGDRAEALALASKYHLVTPVSGAVVLETKQQFEANDLEPGQAGQVPTVPEPGTWALLGLVAVVLGVAIKQRHRVPRAV
jgi:hypothetical protein